MHATASIPGIGVQFWRLTKPRVVSLIVFTAVIGMLLVARMSVLIYRAKHDERASKSSRVKSL